MEYVQWLIATQTLKVYTKLLVLLTSDPVIIQRLLVKQP